MFLSRFQSLYSQICVAVQSRIDNLATFNRSVRIPQPSILFGPGFRKGTVMGLFSRTKNAPAFTASAVGPDEHHHPGGRTPPNLDRQRLLAATVGNPRRFWEEALAARYDLETIQMCARPVQQDVGTSTLIALKGGHWTREEIALQNAISQCRSDLDAGIGAAKECLDNRQFRGYPGLDDQIRDTSIHWRELIKAWQIYRAKQGTTWVSRVLPQVRDTAGKVLGLV